MLIIVTKASATLCVFLCNEFTSGVNERAFAKLEI